MSTNEGEYKKNKQAFQVMHCLRRNRQLCDVTLIADDVEVYAHKVVLASCSLYFHAKFVIGKTGDKLMMKGISGRILDLLIDYMYTSKLNITAYNVKELLVGSNFLMLRQVGEDCCKYMTDTLDPTNCFDTVEWATRLNLLELKSVAEEYISQHFVNMIDHREFLVTSYENILAVCSSATSKRVPSETLMDVISSWIGYDLENRKLHLDALLDNVDMSLISPEYLMRKLDDPLFKGSLQYMTKAMEIIRSHYLAGGREDKQPVKNQSENAPVLNEDWEDVSGPEDKQPVKNQSENEDWEDVSGSEDEKQPDKNQSENASLLTRYWQNVSSKPTVVPLSGMSFVVKQQPINRDVRVASNQNLVVAGQVGNYVYLESYDFKRKQWIQIPFLSNSLEDGRSYTFLGNKLYLISGLFNDTVVVFNIAEQSWENCENFVGNRGNMGVTTLNGSIYAVGGRNGRQNMIYYTAKVYHSNLGEWEVIKSMQVPRENPGIGVLNGRVYVVGGYDGSRYLKHVECYDPDDNKWLPWKSMNFKRSSCGVVGLNGILYVIGGSNDDHDFLNTVETFNPNNNTWTARRSMRVPRAGAGVIAIKNQIYVIGGRNKKGLLKSVEVYDPIKNVWFSFPDMLIPKEKVTTKLMHPSKLSI